MALFAPLAAAAQPWRFNREVWLMMGNTLFIQAALAANALIFNLYLSSLGLREDFIGLFAFASTAGIGGFAFPASYLSNRFGPRNCLAIASVVMGLAGFGVALVSNQLFIIAVGAVLGAGCALIFVPGGPFLMEHTDGDERMRVFSLNFAVISTALVIGSLAGYLPGLFSSALGLRPDQLTEAYRLTLLVSAAFCTLGFVPMLFVRRREPRPAVASARRASIEPLNDRDARRLLPPLAVAVALIALANGVYLPFYNVFLTEHLGASVESVGLIFALGAFLMIPASLLGPSLVRRFGVISAIAAPRLLTVPFLILVVLNPTLSTGALVYFFRCALMTITWPIDNSFTLELMPPRLRAMIGAVRSASWNVSWAIASLVAGQLIVAFGYWLIFVVAALLHVVGVAYFVVTLRGYARPPTPRTVEA